MKQASKFPHLILGLSAIIDVVLLDQISKWFLTEQILRPETGGQPVGFVEWILNAPERVGFASVPVMPYANLTMVWNEGVSFGLMQGAGILPLVILTVIISSVLLYLMMKSATKFETVSYGMIVGGAIGNVIDRFRFGGVADFFDIYVGTYHWPAFNVADSAITIGVALLLTHGLFMTKKAEDKKIG